MKERRSYIDLIWWLVLIAWSLTILFPIVWVLYESLKTNPEFFQNVWTLPDHPQWMNYKKAWLNYNLLTAMLNTLYYVGASLVIGTFLTALNAYALTRIEFKGRKFIWGMIMLSLFLPGINALIPQYILMRDLHLTNSLTGLILLNCLGESVFFLMLLGGFMRSLPRELEESGTIDGASIFKMFIRIIVPLSMPGIVTVAIFKFIGLYNSFLEPFIYLSDSSKYTIGVNIYHANMLMQYTNDWVTLFAGVIITMIPSVLVFMFFQRWIMEGATLGSVKG
ncbi:carbohydrate ABC transporter permease [Paenibacillus pasadenensis]|uniref:Sugar ABC transporter permease n=1 Tax=Paenibacillus pasadenensis TaxID=217090 RepID=A0A2N5N514_9BACL|nr:MULTISPECIES: carbohydrate ABC transporter permease [Paenibacillus]PLT45435.1 sugar ABC transporter permease [Paenibacillus pasadenensis]QGG55922.1 ABC transporter permease subunit [Paenibacillus sp. B01]